MWAEPSWGLLGAIIDDDFAMVSHDCVIGRSSTCKTAILGQNGPRVDPQIVQSRPNIDWTDFAQRLTHESLLMDHFLDAGPFTVLRRILARKGTELKECFGNTANICPL